MRILSFQAENFKRIKVVAIKPGRHMVEIAGNNEQGKSSVLDAIEAAIRGARHIQAEPLRKGAKTGSVKLTLGEDRAEYIVERKFVDGDTVLVLSAPSGAKQKAPQDILNTFVGAIAFDPLIFATSDAKGQYDMLRAVSGITLDFAELDGLNQRDFDQRTGINREITALKARADAIELAPDLPDSPISTSDLIDEIANAGSQNAILEKRRERRAASQQTIDKMDERLVQADAEFTTAQARIESQATAQTASVQREIISYQEQIQRLQQQLQEAEGRLTTIKAGTETAIEDAAKARDAAKDAIRQETETLRESLATAEPLPDPVDIAEIRKKLTAAEATNETLQARGRKQSLLADAEDKQRAADRLTAVMDERNAVKRRAIEEAKMPIEGLSFSSNGVTYNDVPFDQAATSVQIRVSMAVAMATNPHLKVIRIKEGAYLDDAGMELIGKMAEEHDFQVWVETIRPATESAIVLEDGMVKGAAKKSGESA